MAVLNTAARHGVPDLATDVLRVFKVSGIAWEEYHLAALIEAFCRNNQLREALITLHIMRSNKITPLPSTSLPIIDSIKDVESLDSAWAIIDEIFKTKSGLDVDALKVIIRAAVLLGDMQRAVGFYKSLSSDYGLLPDVTIFNSLLDGCIAAQHRQLGDVLLADLTKSTFIKPNEETYEKIIKLCLTQDVYEDAFYYLEEMKAAGFVPTQTVYEALVLKCHSMGDTRMDIALEEMLERGYSKPRFISKKPSRPSTKELEVTVGLDEGTRKYIETGGMSRRELS
jgi:pentatricopeptide repeat protein